MTAMAYVGWFLFLVVGLIHIGFLRHSARRIEAMSEYIEFLFQNRSVYETHRDKYVSMLQHAVSQSPQGTLRMLAMHSKQAADDIAESVYKQAAVSNAFGRAQVDNGSIAIALAMSSSRICPKGPGAVRRSSTRAPTPNGA